MVAAPLYCSSLSCIIIFHFYHNRHTSVICNLKKKMWLMISCTFNPVFKYFGYGEAKKIIISLRFKVIITS